MFDSDLRSPFTRNMNTSHTGHILPEIIDVCFLVHFAERDGGENPVSMTNVKSDDETVSMGDKRCKVYSLVDVDCAALPSLKSRHSLYQGIIRTSRI